MALKYLILYLIDKNKNHREIMEDLGIRRSTFYKNIDILLEKGFIKKEGTNYIITEKGKKYLEENKEKIYRHYIERKIINSLEKTGEISLQDDKVIVIKLNEKLELPLYKKSKDTEIFFNRPFVRIKNSERDDTYIILIK